MRHFVEKGQKTDGYITERALSLPKFSAWQEMLVQLVRWICVLPVFLLVILAARITFNILNGGSGDLSWGAHLLMAIIFPALAIQLAAATAPFKRFAASIVLASIFTVSQTIVLMLSVATLAMQQYHIPQSQSMIGIISSILAVASTIYGCYKVKTDSGVLAFLRTQFS